jgi:hypothetical protein
MAPIAEFGGNGHHRRQIIAFAYGKDIIGR